MPLSLPLDFPAVELLREEGLTPSLFEKKSLPDHKTKQVVRLLVLNLMPTKLATEVDLLRLFLSSPLYIEVEFLRLSSHTSKNTSETHLDKYYTHFEHLKYETYDGFLITGAPVELLEYEQVTYWKELCGYMDWATDHVKSTFMICWAAQAGLYHFYGVPKYPLRKKMFGLFTHQALQPNHFLVHGFDDSFMVPHSRHTEVREVDIKQHKNLDIISVSNESGIYMVADDRWRRYFVTGHSEYTTDALAKEYWRDVNKNLPIDLPINYFEDNNPNNAPKNRWRAHARLLFNNWLISLVE